MNFSFRKQQQRWIWPSRSAGSRVWSKSTDNQYDDDHEHEDFAPEEPERDNGWTANPKIRAIGIESYNSAFSTGISPFSMFWGILPFPMFWGFHLFNVLGISPFPMFWGFHLFQCFGDFTLFNILGISPFPIFWGFHLFSVLVILRFPLFENNIIFSFPLQAIWREVPLRGAHRWYWIFISDIKG